MEQKTTEAEAAMVLAAVMDDLDQPAKVRLLRGFAELLGFTVVNTDQLFQPTTVVDRAAATFAPATDAQLARTVARETGDFTRQQIADYLRTAVDRKLADIRAHIGKSESVAVYHLKKLEADGRVAKVGHGRWAARL